jgi:hypothetical protein
MRMMLGIEPRPVPLLGDQATDIFIDRFKDERASANCRWRCCRNFAIGE